MSQPEGQNTDPRKEVRSRTEYRDTDGRRVVDTTLGWTKAYQDELAAKDAGKEEKRSFWSKINPRNWFRRKSQETPATHTSALPYDPALIQDYSEELYAAEPAQTPFVSHFSKGNKHLYYVSAHHGAGLDNPTLPAIQKSFDSFSPQLVVIEGLETHHGISPPVYQKHVREMAAQHFSTAGEEVFTAHLAMERGIPFIGGEPAEKDVFAQMEKRGYSAKEVQAFYLLRTIPHLRERHGLNASNFDERAQDYLMHNDCFDHIPPQQRLTVDEFKQWYAQHNEELDRSYLDIQTRHMAPIRSQYATRFEDMAYATGQIREKHLDGLIKEACEKNDRVLVVYGMGHLVQSRKVFEHMFGKEAENMRVA